MSPMAGETRLSRGSLGQENLSRLLLPGPVEIQGTDIELESFDRASAWLSLGPSQIDV